MSALTAAALCPLTAATADACGGKAAGLRSLLDAGLPVPAGACLTFDAYRAALPRALPAADLPLQQVAAACDDLRRQLRHWRPPPARARAWAAALAPLGWPLVARSSASCEDRPGRSGAGVFHSVLEIDGLEALWSAVGRVWSSLWSPLAWAVLRPTGSAPGREAMAVILQAQIPARWAGLLRAPDFGDAARMRVEAVRGPGAALAAGEVAPTTLSLPLEGALPAVELLPRPQLERLRELARRAWSQSGADAVELEWVGDGRQIWLVQQRVVAARDAVSAAPSVPATPAEAALGADGRRWRWDREHNPLPLSPAHASLIDHLDRALGPPPRLAVINGYLFEAVDRDGDDARGDDADALRRLSALLDEERNDSGDDPARRLSQVLDRFVAFHRRYAAGARQQRRAAAAALRRFLQQQPGLARWAGDAAVAELSLGDGHATQPHTAALWQLAARAVAEDRALLRWIETPAAAAPPPPALAAYLRRFGALAPCWDVATPTFAERPQQLRATLAAMVAARRRGEDERRTSPPAAALLPRLQREISAAAAARLAALVDRVRAARAAGEADDLLFARAVGQVRRALLAAARVLQQRGALTAEQQVFGLALPAIAEALGAGAAPEALARRAAAGLARWRTQHRHRPPPELGRPPLALAGEAARRGPLLTGQGIGAAVEGRVRRVDDPQQLPQDVADRVLVCASLIPALAPALSLARALVTDHGGLLSHAALLAREAGVPAVVGTEFATALLADGDRVWVDGTRGCVVPLERVDRRG